MPARRGDVDVKAQDARTRLVRRSTGATSRGAKRAIRTGRWSPRSCSSRPRRVEWRLPTRRSCGRFPTLERLAHAPAMEVIQAWRGLGYNRRAVDLQRAAQAHRRRARRRLPSEPAALRRLPGLGEYSSSAIACFAFDAQVPVVDTNVRRVLARAALGKDASEVPAEQVRDARRGLAARRRGLPLEPGSDGHRRDGLPGLASRCARSARSGRRASTEPRAGTGPRRSALRSARNGSRDRAVRRAARSSTTSAGPRGRASPSPSCRISCIPTATATLLCSSSCWPSSSRKGSPS